MQHNYKINGALKYGLFAPDFLPVLFIWIELVERNDSLKQFINGRPIYNTGNYYCIEIE